MPEPRGENGWRAPLAIVIVIGVLGWLMTTEHRAHALGALPFLLILSCPLVHMLMHGGHGANHAPNEHPRGPHE